MNVLKHITIQELRNAFTHETGIEVFNSQGEPDIDYVAWLEEKFVSNFFVAYGINEKEKQKDENVKHK